MALDRRQVFSLDCKQNVTQTIIVLTQSWHKDGSRVSQSLPDHDISTAVRDQHSASEALDR
jgi:hypothetical protein